MSEYISIHKETWNKICRCVVSLHALLSETSILTAIVPQDPQIDPPRKREVPLSSPEVLSIFNYFNLKTNKCFKLSLVRAVMIARALKVYSVEEVKEAIDAFVADPWPERKRFLDPVYCFGKQRGKADNLERWISASKMEQKKKVRYE